MKQLRVLSLPYLVWMVIFIVVPIIMVAFFAFTTSDGNFTIDKNGILKTTLSVL